jgi:hypothetical protein
MARRTPARARHIDLSSQPLFQPRPVDEEGKLANCRAEASTVGERGLQPVNVTNQLNHCNALELLSILQCNIFLAFIVRCTMFTTSKPTGFTPRGMMMVKNFEDLQTAAKDNLDTTLKSFGALSKSGQAIAVEVADYSKKSFEQGTATLEKLFGVKSLDKAFEVQSEYAKSAYEGFVAEATKLGELYADFAKETYKPFEAALARAK